MKSVRILAATLFLAFLSLPALAGQANGKSFLVHAKTSLKQDDAQIRAVPNVAWTALQEGYKVTILFDASGVTSIKKGGWFGGDRTPMDKAALPERERRSLAGQLGVPPESVPRNYGE
jgi:hypothetical protein